MFTSAACRDVGRAPCAVPEDAGFVAAATLATGATAALVVLAFVFATCGLFDACCNVCWMAALEVCASSARPAWQMARTHSASTVRDSLRAIWPFTYLDRLKDPLILPLATKSRCCVCQIYCFSVPKKGRNYRGSASGGIRSEAGGPLHEMAGNQP